MELFAASAIAPAKQQKPRESKAHKRHGGRFGDLGEGLVDDGDGGAVVSRVGAIARDRDILFNEDLRLRSREHDVRRV